MPDTPPNRSPFAAGVKNQEPITDPARPGRQRDRPAPQVSPHARLQRATETQAAHIHHRR